VNLLIPSFFLVLGGFVLAEAILKQGLDKLLGQRLLKIAKGNFYKSSILLMLATSLTSSWVNNTFTFAIMLPLRLGILVLVNKSRAAETQDFCCLELLIPLIPEE
jgi:sodium-dependent dicarboxylate transporter 2/3/5